MTRTHSIYALLVVMAAFAGTTGTAKAQTREAGTTVSGLLTVTNKGISTVPSFSLGRPAAIFDLSVRRGRFSFDPQFRFGLDGKPWTFQFWGRYRVLDGEQLRLTVGTHPALSFRTASTTVNGVRTDLIAARRYMAGELAPDFMLGKNITLGPYYLYSYCIEDDAARHNHFLSARVTFSNIRLSDRFVARLNPQFYYLRVDDRDGVYLFTSLVLSRQGLPVSLAAIANLPVRTDVPGGGDFLWNLSLLVALR